MTEDRQSEWGQNNYRTTKLTQSEKDRKQTGEKQQTNKKTEPTDLWDNNKRPNIHIIRVLEERTMGLGLKEHLKKNGWKIPKFDERHKLTDPRSWANPKQDKVLT